MRSYRIHMIHMILFRCLILALLSCVSAGHVVKTRHNESVTLPCKRKCSGLVKWVLTHSRNDVIAQCNQTHCSSKEGYEMCHDQYLKGDVSLTITAADYSKRCWYTCQCDGKDVCDVRLSMERVNFTRVLVSGESLVLGLPISERVKIMLNRSSEDGTLSSVTLCTVEGRKVYCDPEYEKKTWFQSSVTLTDLKQTDIGVYTVWDTENDDIISTYTVTLTGKKPTSFWQGVEENSVLISGIAFGLGLLLGWFLHHYVPTSIQKCIYWAKRKEANFSECNHSTAKETVDSTEVIQLTKPPATS